MEKTVTATPQLKIATLLVDPPIILAPMEGLTDLHFRRLLRRIGGTGLTTTEFVSSEGLVRNIPRVLEMAEFDQDEVPVAVQIYGRNPSVMAEAARMVEGMGAHVVDINMGCPSRKVCAHSGGAALMAEPALAGRIVGEVRSATSIPLTVKMRAGQDRDHVNAPELAWICQEQGVDAVTVHWRTRQEAFKGGWNVDVIAQVRERLSIPVVANGDITDTTSAGRMLRETACHGLMVGRGALRDPWLPLLLARWMRGEPAPRVTMARRRAFLQDYIDGVRNRFRTERAALGRTKKLCTYFTRALPRGACLRRNLLRSQSFSEFFGHLDAYFSAFETDAGETCRQDRVPGPVTSFPNLQQGTSS